MTVRIPLRRIKHPLIRQLVEESVRNRISLETWSTFSGVGPNTIRNAISGRAVPSLDNFERMATGMGYRLILEKVEE